MTEHDPLETELLALRPREPSADMKRRIADQLAAEPARQKDGEARLRPSHNHRARRWRSFGVLAAGVLALLLAWTLGRRVDPKIESPTAGFPLQPHVEAAFDDALPSLWAYRTALTQSAEALDALLDKHANGNPVTKPERARDFVFARFNTELDALTGEL